MHHVRVAGKSLLIGDEATDALLHYAAALGRHRTADEVMLQALGPDGNYVTVKILLNAGTSLIAETAASDLPEPDNTGETARILNRVAMLDRPPTAREAEPPPDSDV